MRTVALAIASTVIAGCLPLPPPPLVPSHAATEPAERGSTQVLVVVGLAGQVLGGGGVGVALRVEHQETDRTTLGLELGGGRGDKDHFPNGAAFRHFLIAVRGYGRLAPRHRDFAAVTYGAGLSVMRTGLVTATLHGGGALSYPNDSAIPTLNLGLALAIPLRDGEGYGGSSDLLAGKLSRPGRSDASTPEPEVYLYGDVGLIALVGSSATSLDLGVLFPLRSKLAIIAASIAAGNYPTRRPD